MILFLLKWYFSLNTIVADILPEQQKSSWKLHNLYCSNKMHIKSDQIHSKVQHSTANLSHCHGLIFPCVHFLHFCCLTFFFACFGMRTAPVASNIYHTHVPHAHTHSHKHAYIYIQATTLIDIYSIAYICNVPI